MLYEVLLEWMTYLRVTNSVCGSTGERSRLPFTKITKATNAGANASQVVNGKKEATSAPRLTRLRT
jgi:hypothetical protein